MWNDVCPCQNSRHTLKFWCIETHLVCCHLSLYELLWYMMCDFFYMCKIGKIRDFKLRNAYNRLCENGVLKEENKVVSKKRLTHALAFPKVFKVEWMKILLRRLHDMKLWLENGLVKITKSIIHQVTGYPTLDWVKTMWCKDRNVIKELTKEK